MTKYPSYSYRYNDTLGRPGRALNQSHKSTELKAVAAVLTDGTLPPALDFGCDYWSIPNWHLGNFDDNILGLGEGRKI